MCNNEDLPDPEGPVKATNSPDFIEKLILLNKFTITLLFL
tara:strand:+ start:198 stop:317 length:120 start_codon:yes stop_codon:yes gene_type:complete